MSCEVSNFVWHSNYEITEISGLYNLFELRKFQKMWFKLPIYDGLRTEFYIHITINPRDKTYYHNTWVSV